MILSMRVQFISFLITILIGFVTGFLYDIFKVIRKIIKHNYFVVQLEDIFYWFIVTIVFFRFIIEKNNGELRFYLIAGVIFGMILYFYTLSNLLVNFIMSVLEFVTKVFLTTLNIFLIPIKFIIKVLSVPLKVILKVILNIFFRTKNNSVKLLKKSRRYGKMKYKKSINNIKIIFKKI